MNINVEEISGELAKNIGLEILAAVKQICEKRGMSHVMRGVFNCPSGVHMGICVVGKVEGDVDPYLRQYVYPLGIPRIAKYTGVSLDDYGKNVLLDGKEVTFVGLVSPGVTDYSPEQCVGSARYKYVFTDEEYMYFKDKEQALSLLHGIIPNVLGRPNTIDEITKEVAEEIFGRPAGDPGEEKGE